MSIVVNTNVASLMTQRNLAKNTQNLNQSIERLSSGYRINRAADDAAGLTISEDLKSQISGDNRASNNIQDGINLLQIAEGGLNVIGDSVQRIRELCVEAANDTNGTAERNAVVTEIAARLSDINRISASTNFNKIYLLNGSIDGTTKKEILQIGADTDANNTLDISSVLGSSTVTTLGLNLPAGLVTAGVVDTSTWTSDNIRTYIDKVDAAVTQISSKRSNIGAYQNRLSSALDNIQTMSQNLDSSQSRIKDVDIAQETANMSKYQILQQAATSVLSQANTTPKIALSLLQQLR